MSATNQQVRIGARSSPLSLIQTEEVLSQLRLRFPHVEFVVVKVNTLGDRNKTAPLLSMDRGMFVKEIEVALLSGDIDMAVHSAKDLPAELPEGLVLGAFTERNDPRDVLVSKSGLPLGKLPANSRLGTSSPRRHALLKSLRNDIEVVPVRGNVGTRLEKAFGADYDGVILAAAGLIRLGMEHKITEYFDPDVFTPDTGQGALAVEARADDTRTLELLAAVDHQPTSAAVRAERAFLEAMGGGCKVPVAAYAVQIDGKLRVHALAAAPDGSQLFREYAEGDSSSPEAVGRSIAESLLKSGAAKLVYGQTEQ